LRRSVVWLVVLLLGWLSRVLCREVFGDCKRLMCGMEEDVDYKHVVDIVRTLLKELCCILDTISHVLTRLTIKPTIYSKV